MASQAGPALLPHQSPVTSLPHPAALPQCSPCQSPPLQVPSLLGSMPGGGAPSRGLWMVRWMILSRWMCTAGPPTGDRGQLAGAEWPPAGDTRLQRRGPSQPCRDPQLSSRHRSQGLRGDRPPPALGLSPHLPKGEMLYLYFFLIFFLSCLFSIFSFFFLFPFFCPSSLLPSLSYFYFLCNSGMRQETRRTTSF